MRSDDDPFQPLLSSTSPGNTEPAPRLTTNHFAKPCGGIVSALGRMVCSAKPGKRTDRVSSSFSDGGAERLWSVQSNIQHEKESDSEKRSPAIPIGAGTARAEARKYWRFVRGRESRDL